MNLWEKLANLDFNAKCEIIWHHYQDRKLKNEFEPEWTHECYELIFKAIGQKLSQMEYWIASEVVKSHSLPDGIAVPVNKKQPSGEERIIHDGWKAGSISWIFMGRSLKADSVLPLSKNWVAVQRTLPDEIYNLIDTNLAPATLWMAYNTKIPLNILHENKNCVGPSIYLEDLKKCIK
jgi:hypothetical protein